MCMFGKDISKLLNGNAMGLEDLKGYGFHVNNKAMPSHQSVPCFEEGAVNICKSERTAFNKVHCKYVGW